MLRGALPCFLDFASPPHGGWARSTRLACESHQTRPPNHAYQPRLTCETWAFVCELFSKVDLTFARSLLFSFQRPRTCRPRVSRFTFVSAGMRTLLRSPRSVKHFFRGRSLSFALLSLAGFALRRLANLTSVASQCQALS